MSNYPDIKPKLQTAAFLILLVLFCAPTAKAQFTIERSFGDINRQFRVIGDSIEAVRRYNYFDPSAERAKKLRLRKERNTVELNVSLEASLQQFENWTGSGNNNFYALANLFFRHQYRKEKLSVDYRIDAVYGLNFIDEAFFKNKDEFKISGQMGWDIHHNWSYSASVNIRSQFTAGYASRTDRTLVSRFMAPGYFDLAAGFTFRKPNSPFKLTLSPIGGNIVTVLDPELSAQGKYGVKPGEKISGKIGPSIDIFFDYTFGKSKVWRYRSNLYTFLPYTDVTNPTVRWENTMEIKLTRFLSTKLYGQLYYRKEDSTALQYQYSFMIGLKYVFRNK